MRRLSLSFCLAALFAHAGIPRCVGAPSFEPFTLQTYDGKEHPAELARIQVPERRETLVPSQARIATTGRTIEVAVMRLKTRARAPGAPIFFLAGGPGIPGIGMARAPFIFRLLDQLRELGDVYVIDQRGTGRSVPSLLCGVQPLDHDLFVSDAKAEAAVRMLVARCASDWRARGVDPASYNTVESASDLEDLRREIGAERVRLVGTSYGSELALEMIRRNGSHVERAVLAGVRGPSTALKLPSTLDLEMRRVASMIARDSTYATILPDPQGLVLALLDVLDRKPFTITVTPREGGEKREYRVGSTGLRMVLQSDLPDANAITHVPAMLATMKDGDPRIFLSRLRAVHEAMARGTTLMSLAVNCASGWDPERLERVRDEAGSSPFANIRNLYLSPALCDSVRAANLGAAFRAPIVSEIPVLFISGSMDATTPPFEAEEIAWGFPNGFHMIVHNGFHETLGIREVQRSVTEYFSGKDIRGRGIVMPPPKFLSVTEALKRVTEEPAPAR